ncbi:MAG: MobF family relaxase [Deltaproteobacteria bacterium]
MISISNLKSAAQAKSYYEEGDYYRDGAEQTPNRWWGEGARRLGLEGEFDQQAFADALAGKLPNGVEMPSGHAGDRLPGIDVTFSPPKSVSLQLLVAGDERIRAAHDQAVEAGLRYFETNFAQARLTRDGVTESERTANLAVARVQHEVSRELDPQLHTHCVILNVTQRSDGAWRALDNRGLYDGRAAADAIYRVELSSRLRALGYDVTRTNSLGHFEIAGYTPEHLEHFSKRRAQIEEAMQQRGEAGARAAERANLMTRASKRKMHPDDLHALWAREARALELTSPPIREVTQRDAGADELANAERAVEHALQHLTERSTVIAERDLKKHALQLGVGRLEDSASVFAAIEAMKQDGRLLGATPAIKKDGDLDRYFTTPKALATERDLVDLVERGRQTVEPIVSPEIVEAQTAARGLTEGQGDAVKLALTTQDRVTGVQGYAGTGKTFALKTFRELAEGQGFEVLGAAPSANAAHLLEEDAGIASRTLAQLLIDVNREDPTPDRKQVWVVDEVSMMGNDDARRLLRAAERHGARVVLVGDEAQLPSIAAGQAFRLLKRRGLTHATMQEVLRQEEGVLREAVYATIRRNEAEALDKLAGRVVSIGTRTDRLQAVADAFLNRPEARDDTIVLTPSNKDRIELNERIRQGLRRDGVLVGDEQRAEVFVSRGFTDAQTRESAYYDVGDVVRFGRNYKRLSVRSGDTLRVVSTDLPKNKVVLEDTTGRRVTWQPHRHANVEVYRAEERRLAVGDRIRWTRNDKTFCRRNGALATVVALSEDGRVAAVDVASKNGPPERQMLNLETQRHWDHAWAVTAHGAQGQTRGRALVHIDTAEKNLVGYENWYVAISRAKRELEVFTDDVDRLPNVIQRPMEQESALEGRARHFAGRERMRLPEAP